jgi:glycerol-3-phosphate acyltransferase PlsX
MSVDEAPRIAIDAMGGDGGPATIIAGAAQARDRDSSLRLTFTGDETVIRAEMARFPQLADSIVVHCDDVITGDDKPSQAIRRTKSS